MSDKERGKVFHKQLSYKIIGILFDVYNDLGYGYQEKYYCKAIEKFFNDAKVAFKIQAPYKITVRGEIIGRYYLDFLVEDKIVLEIKKGDYFSKKNIEQIKGYLKATNKDLAIIASFTSKGVKYFRALNPNNVI